MVWLIPTQGPAWAQAVDLGTARGFGVLGASAVTNTGATVVNGDLGISPNDGSWVTGFPPGVVLGTTHFADAVALQAQNDLTSAYNDLAGRACDTVISADLGGMVLTPGVYCSASSMGLTGTLTLDAQNDLNAVFIFQMGSTLTTISGASVNLINGGQSCNVYWQVGSSATLGTGSGFIGSILAQADISAATGASSRGSLLARTGAVTLDGNAISNCVPILSVAKSVSPNPVITGTSAVYTVVVSNEAGDASTQGNLVLYDNLANDLSLIDTAGSDPGWSCLGSVELVCTYSGILAGATSSTLKLNVDIGLGALTGDNTARVSGSGDALCPAPPAPAAARCSATVLATTVPVVVSDVDASVAAGLLTVSFGTLTEIATLGYHVLTGNADGPRAALNKTLLAAGEHTGPHRYQSQGPYHGERQVWIEELTMDGGTITYGPFPVGIKVGRAADSVAIDWSVIRAEQSSFRSRQTLNLRATGNAQEAELQVNVDAWYSVDFEELLAQGLDWQGALPTDLRLRRGSANVPLRHTGGRTFGPGSRLAFLGHAISGSLYTRNAVYRLSREPTAEILDTRSAPPTTAAAVASVRANFRHEPNRLYLATAAGADPWYALKLQRSGLAMVSASETFILPGRASDSSHERIKVEIWGGLDYPQSPDHSVRLLVNDTEVANLRFDGISVQVIEVALPAGLLRNGNNTATLQLMADTGLSVDQVLLNALTVDYHRELRVSDNRLDFSLPAETLSSVYGQSMFIDSFEDGGALMCAQLSDCDHYQISGLSQPDIVVLRERAGNIVELSDVHISAIGSAYQLNFASNRHPLDRYWIAPKQGNTPALLSAQLATGDPLAGGKAQLLIIAHPSFVGGLDALVNARLADGFSVRVLDIEALYRRYSDGAIDPNAVQRAVADAFNRLGTRYVLLVGGDTYDYFNNGGSDSISFIPTHYRQTDRFVRYAAADSVSADVDGDGLMDVALGRLPVRTAQELAITISKTLVYQQAGHGGRLLLQADRADPLQFDEQLAAIANMLGTHWTATSLSLDDYPAGSQGTDTARLALSTAVNAGQAFTAYLGHSAPNRWTFSGLLSAQDVYAGFFSNIDRPTVLWSLGCYGTNFVQPNYDTIAHAMMLQNSGGAAAVLGASGLTTVSSDVAWINTLMLYLPHHRLGDAMMLSQRLLHASGSQFDDVAIGGNLLGDPTLRLNQ